MWEVCEEHDTAIDDNGCWVCEDGESSQPFHGWENMK